MKFDSTIIIIVAVAIIIALWTHGPIRSKRSCAIFIAAIIVAAGSSSFRGAPGESAAPNGRRSPRAPALSPLQLLPRPSALFRAMARPSASLPPDPGPPPGLEWAVVTRRRRE